MATVVNEFKEKCFVPGVVQSISVKKSVKLFTVMYFNGIEGINKRNEIIAITKTRYGLLANFLRKKLGLDDKYTANIRKFPSVDISKFSN
jgi:hypothetical protein